jgi:hypothetical protein
VAKLTFKYVPPDNLPGLPAGPAAHEAACATPARERHGERSFHESSWDLQRGLQVNEDLPDDIPSELFEQLFGA